jgi:hypothetical protein
MLSGGRCSDSYTVFQIPIEIHLGSEIRPYGQYRRRTPKVLIQELDVAWEPDFPRMALPSTM